MSPIPRKAPTDAAIQTVKVAVETTSSLRKGWFVRTGFGVLSGGAALAAGAVAHKEQHGASMEIHGVEQHCGSSLQDCLEKNSPCARRALHESLSPCARRAPERLAWSCVAMIR